MCSKKGDDSGDHITLTLNSDIKATSLAVDYHGKYCLLAGKQHLFVLDITRPTAEVVRKIFRANKLEVSFCQWNPNSSHSDYFITNNNNECQLWKWGTSIATSPVDIFKAHARTITDANWSHQDGNLLATCSIDAFTNLWDIRQTKRSVISFQSVVSAFHVKWNRQNGSLLATAHEGDIRIWDWRNNRSAVHCITGHHNRISDMDWSPASGSSLVSCAHDNIVKVWDISRNSRPVERLRSDDPTWKVKFAPYGQAVVTVAMSHLRHIENYLHLRFLTHKYSQQQSVGSDESVIVKYHKQGDMVHALGGHHDVVYDVCWRLDAAAGYQMVSWSRDHTLRIWNIGCDLRKNNDEVNTAAVIDSVSPVRKSSSVISESSIVSNSDYNTGSNAHLDVISVTGTEKNNLSYPTTLLHEFKLLNFDIPNVYIDKMDVESRTCHVRAVNGTFLVGLAMHFPDIYPTNVAPSFVLIGETSLDNLQQSRLFKMLHNTALQHVKHNRCCIEPCLRQLVTYLDSLQAESQQSTPDTPSDMTGCSRKSSVSTVNRSALSQHFQVVLRARNVPFPRTSGARFCGAGFLVCFTRRIVEIQQEVADDVQQTVSDADLLPTPRAMSALSELTQSAQLHTYSSYNYGSYSSSLARSLPIDAALPSVSKYYHLKDQVLPTASSSRSTIKVKCNSTGESQSVESNSSRVTNAPPSKQIVTGPVVIYDIFCLLPVSRELAQHYVFDKDHVQMCKKNATVAAMFQRPDLVQAWTVAMLCKERLLADEVATVTNNIPWMEHMFGRTMIKSLFRHYSALQDVQTLAMLSCVFTSKHTASNAGPTKSASIATTSSLGSNAGGGGGTANECLQSNMDLLIPHESFLSTSLTTVSKFRRSNSWSEAFDDMTSNTESDVTLSTNKSENHSRSVLDAASGQYDVYKKVYAGMLFQFGFINQRADLMKHITNSGNQHLPAGLVDITVVCSTCDRAVKSANDSVKCLHCRSPAIKCVVCRLSVRGLYSVCSACLHGGHTSHMSEWFATHAQCPAGCGCQCLYWQRNSFCVNRLAI